MKYKKPTYEEYCNASKYAVIRYKFGCYIQLISAVLLLFLLYYTITNIEEMKSNPIDYAENKLNVNCFPAIIPNIYDGSIGNIKNIEKK